MTFPKIIFLGSLFCLGRLLLLPPNQDHGLVQMVSTFENYLALVAGEEVILLVLSVE